MSRSFFTARASAAPAEIEPLMERAEALDPPPLAVSAIERRPGDWLVELLYAHPPDPVLLARALGRPVDVSGLADENWVKKSLEGLPPVRIGRFAVFGAHDRGRVPTNLIALEIEASLAFGTGHHATTAGCLAALSALLKRRRPRRALDLGTGTGVLALALAAATKRPVTACDIDAVAVRVARANARANGLKPWLAAVAADGLRHPLLRTRAPFDLILANILAGPLCRLAGPLCAALAPDGSLILSGLLSVQAREVFAAYRNRGLRLLARHVHGEWTTLVCGRAVAAVSSRS